MPGRPADETRSPTTGPRSAPPRRLASGRPGQPPESSNRPGPRPATSARCTPFAVPALAAVVEQQQPWQQLRGFAATPSAPHRDCDTAGSLQTSPARLDKGFDLMTQYSGATPESSPMSPASRRFVDALRAIENNGDIEDMAGLGTDDTRWWSTGVDRDHHGPDGARRFWEAYRPGFRSS